MARAHAATPACSYVDADVEQAVPLRLTIIAGGRPARLVLRRLVAEPTGMDNLPPMPAWRQQVVFMDGGQTVFPRQWPDGQRRLWRITKLYHTCKQTINERAGTMVVRWAACL